MSADKIVRMANQIAAFMASKPHDEGVSALPRISTISGSLGCAANSSN